MPIPLILLPAIVAASKKLLAYSQRPPKCRCSGPADFTTSCCGKPMCHSCTERIARRGPRGVVLTCPYCRRIHSE